MQSEEQIDHNNDLKKGKDMLYEKWKMSEDKENKIQDFL